MKKKSVKVFPSLFIAIVVSIGVLMGYAILVFYFVYPSDEPRSVFIAIIAIGLFGVLPTWLVFMLGRDGYYSVVTINEKGISRALFGVLLKKEITWEELKEIKYIHRVIDRVFVSKTDDIANLTFEQLIKRRDLIQIAMWKKVLQIIREYTDKEIIGLPEERVQAIIRDKNAKE